MSKFLEINLKTVSDDAVLAKYLKDARTITNGKKGGIFVGNYTIAPETLRTYGIILPKGGLIIPDMEPDELRHVLQQMYDMRKDELLRQEKEAEAMRQSAEQKIAKNRTRLLPFVVEAFNVLKDNAGPDWKLQALEYGKDKPSSCYDLTKVWKFETAHKIGLLELSPITSAITIFEWTDKDIARLTNTISKWLEVSKPRLDLLWKLFVNSNGVFTKTENKESCYAGKSFGSAMRTAGTSHYSEGKWDEWIEVTYYIGGEKITELEHKWLKSRSNEVETPQGYVRVDNGLNELFPIPPNTPGYNDVLVVIGKTGSRRGIWSYGEWFHGHPADCKIPFWHKGTYGKIKSVSLNGNDVPSRYVNLEIWKDPRMLAMRALEEAHVKPTKEHIKALEGVYQKP